MASPTLDQFWTIAAFDESDDEASTPLAYSVLPGSGSFILENLKAGTYVVRCWFDENQDLIPDEDELNLYNEVGQINSVRQVPPADVSLLFTDMQIDSEVPEDSESDATDPQMPDQTVEGAEETQPMPTETKSGGCSHYTTTNGLTGFVWCSVLLLLCLYRRERCR